MSPTSSESLARLYRLRFEQSCSYRDDVWRVLCNEFFSRIVPEEATVLDLGAGWGEFIRNIAARRKYALDLNPDSRVRAASDVVTLSQDCTTDWPLPPASLDVVFTSNLLEHLPSKAHVESAIAQAYRCLKPGGQLICLGPNITYVGGAYWDFWDHHIAFTDRSITELMRISGFAVERSIERFLPYTMSDGRRYPIAILKLYLKLPIAWRFFGKQFLVVGRKPEHEEHHG